MQTRSITKKLANALATNSHASNNCSAKNTSRQRSKIGSSDKNSKSKDKIKSTVPAEKMGTEVKKRRSQRLMTEEEKSVQNDKEVAQETSSLGSDEPREKKKKKKKESPPLPRLKRNKPTKRGKEEPPEEVKKDGEVEEREKVEEVKKIRKAKKVIETEEKIKVKVEVSKKDKADLESRPPTPKKIKVENGGQAVGEESISKETSAEHSSFTSEKKIDVMKKGTESQVQLSDVKKDIKNEDQSNETEQSRESSKPETKMVACKEEQIEEDKNYCPTQGKQKKDSEAPTEEERGEESVNRLGAGEGEAASTSVPKESSSSKPKETLVQGFDIRIAKLPDDFLSSVREKRLLIGGSRSKEKKDKKTTMKEACKRKVWDDKNYIPLNSSGATKFFVADMKVLKKSGLNHPAVDVKRDLLYGPRIKRVPYSKVLAYKMKSECRNMRY